MENIEARLPTKDITPFQVVKYRVSTVASVSINTIDTRLQYMLDVKSRIVDVVSPTFRVMGWSS